MGTDLFNVTGAQLFFRTAMCRTDHDDICINYSIYKAYKVYRKNKKEEKTPRKLTNGETLIINEVTRLDRLHMLDNYIFHSS